MSAGQASERTGITCSGSLLKSYVSCIGTCIGRHDFPVRVPRPTSLPSQRDAINSYYTCLTQIHLLTHERHLLPGETTRSVLPQHRQHHRLITSIFTHFSLPHQLQCIHVFEGDIADLLSYIPLSRMTSGTCYFFSFLPNNNFPSSSASTSLPNFFKTCGKTEEGTAFDGHLFTKDDCKQAAREFSGTTVRD